MKKMKSLAFGFFAALFIVGSFAAPSSAAYFESSLKPWQEKTWIASSYKGSASTTFWIKVDSNSPHGGHFWVDTNGGKFIGKGIDVYPGKKVWSAYQGWGRNYKGGATVYGREFGMGPFYDSVKGYYELNA